MGETVVVCRKCKGHECLVDFLLDRTDAAVRMVRCQKVCSGPVAGVVVDGRMEWFERVGRAKPMVALARLATKPERAKMTRPLAKRRVAKRSGRPPR